MAKARAVLLIVAAACAVALMPSVCEAGLSFTLADSSTWPSAAEWLDVYGKMTYNTNLYNAYATFGPYNIYVYYSSGIPTEQASYGGYGGSIGVGQQYPQFWNLQHEMSHYLGTGTYWQWPNLMYSGVWHGAAANALEQQFDGVGAVLSGDTAHFWPYGLNYATEDSHIAEERHLALDYALLQDMGLEPATPASSATVVTLTSSDPVGTSGFNYMDNWSDAHFAQGNANYFTGNYAARTPADGASYTFAGKSLTLNNGGDPAQGLFYKGSGNTGVITFSNLILNNGSTHHYSTTADLFQLAGQLTVAGYPLAGGGGTLNSEQGNTNVLAALTGDGNLTIGVTNGNLVTLLSPSNTFTGNINVVGGFQLANGANQNFTIGANGTNNAITGASAQQVLLNGVFNLNLTGASTRLGDSWPLVSAANTTYGGTFAVSGYTNNGGLWVGPSGYEFLQSTGRLMRVTGSNTVFWAGVSSLNWSQSTNWSMAIANSGSSLLFSIAGAGGATLIDNLMTPGTYNLAGITFAAVAPAYTINVPLNYWFSCSGVDPG